MKVLTRALLSRLLSSNRFLGSEVARRFRREVVDPSGDRYTISIANTPDELVEHFRLRYVAYLSHDYLNPGYAFPDELEYDDDDLSAALFNVRNQRTGDLHGVARLAFDIAGHLPMDEYFSLDDLRDRIGYQQDPSLVLTEFSRLISHPVGQRAINKALVRSVFRFAVENDVDYIVGAGRVDIRHYYDKWGFQDVAPGVEIDLRTLDTTLYFPMRLYPHVMHTRNIRWECI